MNIFKKIKGVVVTAYAKMVYNNIVRIAEEKYRKEHIVQFAFSPFGQGVVVLNRHEFHRCKNKLKISGSLYSSARLREGCWYYTKDGNGKNGLSEKDIEIRKMAFIRYYLKKANL